MILRVIYKNGNTEIFPLVKEFEIRNNLLSLDREIPDRGSLQEVQTTIFQDKIKRMEVQI